MTGRKTPSGAAKAFVRTAARHSDKEQCLIWPFRHAGNGYGKVGNAFAHREVCRAAHGPAPSASHYATHGCGNGALGCVNPHHLKWATPAENCADQKLHGTVNRGSRNGAAKIGEIQARQIKALAGRQTQQAVADQFQISRAAVSDIQTGRRWAWL